VNTYQPLVIRRSDPGKLEIEWADGHRTSYTAAELRGVCPCAGCINEVTGVRMHDPASVPASLTQSDVRFVGNYAIALQFSDGHNTGIFPFRYLRDHDPKA
jgi:DUF971 family protein